MMSRAVNHLLEQIKRDPRLAYLIGPGSQSFDLLIQEGAAHAGRDVDECRAEFEVGLRFEPWPTASVSDIVGRINAAVEVAFRPRELPLLPQGWIWMRHPSRDAGQWLPAQVHEVGGERFYRPFDVKACEFAWDARNQDWETYPSAPESLAVGALASAGQDC